MAITVRWHCRKLGTPPQPGSLAYCVLQNDLQLQPVNPVFTSPSLPLITAGYLQRPMLDSSHPSPGHAVNAIIRVGTTLYHESPHPPFSNWWVHFSFTVPCAWHNNQRSGSSLSRISKLHSSPVRSTTSPTCLKGRSCASWCRAVISLRAFESLPFVLSE